MNIFDSFKTSSSVHAVSQTLELSLQRERLYWKFEYFILNFILARNTPKIKELKKLNKPFFLVKIQKVDFGLNSRQTELKMKCSSLDIDVSAVAKVVRIETVQWFSKNFLVNQFFGQFKRGGGVPFLRENIGKSRLLVGEKRPPFLNWPKNWLIKNQPDRFFYYHLFLLSLKG